MVTELVDVVMELFANLDGIISPESMKYFTRIDGIIEDNIRNIEHFDGIIDHIDGIIDRFDGIIDRFMDNYRG